MIRVAVLLTVRYLLSGKVVSVTARVSALRVGNSADVWRRLVVMVIPSCQIGGRDTAVNTVILILNHTIINQYHDSVSCSGSEQFYQLLNGTYPYLLASC